MTLNLFYSYYSGELWRWPLTDYNAWSNETAVPGPPTGKPAGIFAAAQIPQT